MNLTHEDNLGWVDVKNTSGEEIPPFAVMQVDDASKQNGEAVVEVVKPDGSGNSFLLNSAYSIGSGANGRGSVAFGKRGALDSGETAPSEGDEWGAKSGQWTLSPDGSGFTVLGDVASNTARVRLTAGSPPADMLKGTVQSVIAAGSGTGSTPTNRVFQLKTSSPAPTPLPTGTPAISGTVYVADLEDKGANIAAGDVIYAIRNLACDSYNPGAGAVDVNWEYLPMLAAGTPFTCVITASLTGATWDNSNKRLTPAANTSTAKLLGWDSANSRYDEASDGTTISPEWVSTDSVTIDSGKCLIGKGIYYDGRYMLMEIDCPDSQQQTYT